MTLVDLEHGSPQLAGELREAARHLLMHPLTTAERNPDHFRTIRRHESALDRWFTQRLGYRLHVSHDTARLYKSTYAPVGRPLWAMRSDPRPLRQLEYMLLALVCACTTAGPDVVSLRDLIEQVRSAAAEADIELVGDTAERRALVSALRWMIDHGLMTELFEHVEQYSTDETADAVLRVRPDRIALLPVPGMDSDAPGLADIGPPRDVPMRQWMRCRLVEDPVLYRDDCTDEQWSELRRRLGEESQWLDEMFGFSLEARAEGVAAIDPTGRLSDRRFPAGGTVGHAALLLIERLAGGSAPGAWRDREALLAIIDELIAQHGGSWANTSVEAPATLLDDVAELLSDLRLAELSPDGGFRLLPAAERYVVDPDLSTGIQGSLL